MLSIKRINHTADEGIQVKADSPEDVFKALAHEMFKIILPDPKSVREKEEHSISVEGDDLSELLVNFLSKLNFLFQTETILLAEITALTIFDKQLSTKFTSDRYDRNRHTLGTEIKAVTYHQIYVRKKSDYWEAQVIFDV